jgi:hypothetical protein
MLMYETVVKMYASSDYYRHKSKIYYSIGDT